MLQILHTAWPFLAAVFLCAGSGAVGGLLAGPKTGAAPLLGMAERFGPAALDLAQLLEGLLPESARPLAQQVTAFVIEAARAAEELWQTGQLPEEDRKAEAEKRLTQGLSLLGVTPDGKVAALLSSAIDFAVALFLPKSHPAATNAAA